MLEQSNELDQYQNEILRIFSLEYFNENEVVNRINILYDQLEKEHYITEHVKSCLIKKANVLHTDDPKFGFMLLYSFDDLSKYHSHIQLAIEKKITIQEFELLFVND